jgi:hypothetical protein
MNKGNGLKPRVHNPLIKKAVRKRAKELKVTGLSLPMRYRLARVEVKDPFRSSLEKKIKALGGKCLRYESLCCGGKNCGIECKYILVYELDGKELFLDSRGINI